MEFRHIDDEQIQDYLDGNHPTRSLVSAHLAQCGSCRKQLQYYREIYTGLAVREKVRLPATFADNITAKIAVESSPLWRFEAWQLLLGSFGLLAGFGATTYLIGLKKIWGFLVNLTGAVKLLATPLADIAIFFSGLNLNFGLLGFAAFAIAFILFLDHFLFQKQRAVSFFK